MKFLPSIILFVIIVSFAPVSAAQENAALPPAFPAFQSVVPFGQYEQDGNPDNGAEPIEWIVIINRGSKVLLLSKYCLEAVPFHAGADFCSFADSSLRTWLNDDFLSAAFTPEEQNFILRTKIENENTETPDGDTEYTENKLFLLSRKEALQYLPEMSDRIAYPTKYAQSNGAKTDNKGAAYWWLRTPDDLEGEMQSVHPSGRIRPSGKQSTVESVFTIRPCMWVSMDAFQNLLPSGWTHMLEKNDLTTSCRVGKTYTYDLLGEDFEEWSLLREDWLHCEIFGETVEKRPMYAFSLGRGDVYVLIFAAIHGNEVANTPILMDAMEDLILRMKNGDEEVMRRLEKVTMVIVPCANPDGYVYGMNYAQKNKLSLRKWNASGVNLNRNFPTPHWGNDAQPGDKDYPGTHAASEPETVALMQLAHRWPYSAMIDFHSKGKDVYYGKGGYAQEDILTEISVDHLNGMTLRLAKAILPSRYRLRLKADADREDGFGSSTDYLFYLGVPAVTVETVRLKVNEPYTPSLIKSEAEAVKMPDLLLKLCDTAVEFTPELYAEKDER